MASGADHRVCRQHKHRQWGARRRCRWPRRKCRWDSRLCFWAEYWRQWLTLFSVPALSDSVLERMFHSHLLRVCSSADFEAACLPAQSLHACRLRTCILTSCQCPPTPLGRQCGNLQDADVRFRLGCHGSFTPAIPHDRLQSSAQSVADLRLKLLSPQPLTFWTVQVQATAGFLLAPQLPSSAEPIVCAQYCPQVCVQHCPVQPTLVPLHCPQQPLRSDSCLLHDAPDVCVCPAAGGGQPMIMLGNSAAAILPALAGNVKAMSRPGPCTLESTGPLPLPVAASPQSHRIAALLLHGHTNQMRPLQCHVSRSRFWKIEWHCSV